MTQTTTKQHAAPTVNSRMTLANVTRGKQERPMRVIVYGVEGVGKSTFAADAPSPIFLCSEDGTSHLDVARFPTPRTWSDALEAVRVLTHEEHSYKTLAIDSLDWLEPRCWAHVCQTTGKANIEEFGYGKGYVLALDQWRTLLARLELLAKTRKMNVVMVAHAAIRRVDDPQTGPFDRYRMKLHEKSADLLREWADAVLFARHEVSASVDKNGKARGRSTGARLAHTQWAAAFDAKNRYGLPATLPLSWQVFADAVAAQVVDIGATRAEIEQLAGRLPADRAEKAMKALREWAGDNPARLAQLLDRVHGEAALASPADDGGEP